VGAAPYTEDTEVDAAVDLSPRPPLPEYLTSARSTASWSPGPHRPHPPPARPPRPDLFRPGELLAGNFEVRALLGSGGMGQVWRAHDRALDRPVAIKAAWRDAPPEALRREARVQASLRNVGLVTAHALLRDGDREFLVMELVRGELLSQCFLASQRLSLDRALDVLLPLCEALEALHAEGLAHCDLKPSNIMRTPEGRVVLLDFGIARAEQPARARGAEAICGSPHFMAPEAIAGRVCRGEAHLVDLYSLGVLTFALLAGRPPFDDDDPVEVLIQQIQRPAPSLAEIRPDLPPALCALVARLLAKRPADRPAAIEEVGEALRRLARHVPADTRRRQPPRG
jgi:serine/threonine-protein kinase